MLPDGKKVTKEVALGSKVTDGPVDDGRTTPGPRQTNDTPIKIDKRPGRKNRTKAR